MTSFTKSTASRRRRKPKSWRSERPSMPNPDDGTLANDGIPRHVAIIMDGNSRWARSHGADRDTGHEAGTENIRQIIEAFGDRGVQYLTLYAFSTENWGRPKDEVTGLMRILSI